MPLQTILDLSTAHIRSTDNELLGRYVKGRPGNASVIAYSYDDYGWTVSTSPIATAKADGRVDAVLRSMREEGFSEDFVNLVVAAEEMGAVMVRMDRDAEYEPGFPAFEWDEDDALIDFEGSPSAGPSV